MPMTSFFKKNSSFLKKRHFFKKKNVNTFKKLTFGTCRDDEKTWVFKKVDTFLKMGFLKTGFLKRSLFLKNVGFFIYIITVKLNCV